MTARAIVLALAATLVGSVCLADEQGARPSGAPNPPPASIPQSTTITPGQVGGSQQPSTNTNTGPTNPSQAPSPSGTGVIVTVPF